MERDEGERTALVLTLSGAGNFRRGWISQGAKSSEGGLSQRLCNNGELEGFVRITEETMSYGHTESEEGAGGSCISSKARSSRRRINAGLLRGIISANHIIPSPNF